MEDSEKLAFGGFGYSCLGLKELVVSRGERQDGGGERWIRVLGLCLSSGTHLPPEWGRVREDR